MPRDKSSSFLSKKSAQNQVKAEQQPQEQQLQKVNNDEQQDELKDTLTPLRKSIKHDKKESKKKSSTATSSSSSASNTPLKKTHNKSLSAPNFIKLDTVSKPSKNETNNDLSNNLTSVNESSSSLEYNNNNNNVITSPNQLINSKNPANLDVSLKNSSRSNVKFHQLFPSVPLNEIVVDSKRAYFSNFQNSELG